MQRRCAMLVRGVGVCAPLQQPLDDGPVGRNMQRRSARLRAGVRIGPGGEQLLCRFQIPLGAGGQVQGCLADLVKAVGVCSGREQLISDFAGSKAGVMQGRLSAPAAGVRVRPTVQQVSYDLGIVANDGAGQGGVVVSFGWRWGWLPRRGLLGRPPGCRWRWLLNSALSCSFRTELSGMKTSLPGILFVGIPAALDHQ